jgi:hypothetical protein
MVEPILSSQKEQQGFATPFVSPRAHKASSNPLRIWLHHLLIRRSRGMLTALLSTSAITLHAGAASASTQAECLESCQRLRSQLLHIGNFAQRFRHLPLTTLTHGTHEVGHLLLLLLCCCCCSAGFCILCTSSIVYVASQANLLSYYTFIFSTHSVP